MSRLPSLPKLPTVGGTQRLGRRARRRYKIDEINQLGAEEILKDPSLIKADPRSKITRLFDLLDLPRNLVGQVIGRIAGVDVKKLRKGTFKLPVIRTSDVLKHLGVKSNRAAAIAGFVGDVITDPLVFLGPAGKAPALARGLPKVLKGGQRAIREAAEGLVRTGAKPGGQIGQILGRTNLERLREQALGLKTPVQQRRAAERVIGRIVGERARFGDRAAEKFVRSVAPKGIGVASIPFTGRQLTIPTPRAEAQRRAVGALGRAARRRRAAIQKLPGAKQQLAETTERLRLREAITRRKVPVAAARGIRGGFAGLTKKAKLEVPLGKTQRQKAAATTEVKRLKAIPPRFERIKQAMEVRQMTGKPQKMLARFGWAAPPDLDAQAQRVANALPRGMGITRLKGAVPVALQGPLHAAVEMFAGAVAPQARAIASGAREAFGSLTRTPLRQNLRALEIGFFKRAREKGNEALQRMTPIYQDIVQRTGASTEDVNKAIIAVTEMETGGGLKLLTKENNPRGIQDILLDTIQDDKIRQLMADPGVRRFAGMAFGEGGIAGPGLGKELMRAGATTEVQAGRFPRIPGKEFAQRYGRTIRVAGQMPRRGRAVVGSAGMRGRTAKWIVYTNPQTGERVMQFALRQRDLDRIQAIPGANAEIFDISTAELNRMAATAELHRMPGVGPQGIAELIRTDPLFAVSRSAQDAERAFAAQQFARQHQHLGIEIPGGVKKSTSEIEQNVPAGYRRIKIGDLRSKQGPARVITEAFPENMAYPDAIAEQVEKAIGLMTRPDKMNALANAIFKGIGLWKAQALFHPSVPVVNMIGDLFNIGAYGVNPGAIWKHFPEAKDMVRGRRTMRQITQSGRPAVRDYATMNTRTVELGGQTYKLGDLAQSFAAQNILDDNLMTDVAQILERGTLGPLKIRGLTPGQSEVVDRMRGYLNLVARANGAVSNVNRSMFAMELMDKMGMTVEQAAIVVNTVLFDYGGKTLFEKKYVSNIIPFWSWMKNNSMYQVRALMRFPAYTVNVPRASQAIEAALLANDAVPHELRPEWLKDQLATQIAGGPEEGVALLGLSALPAQESMNLLRAATGDARELAQQVAGSLGPLSALFSEAAGREIFTGREIEGPGEVSGVAGRLFGGLRPVREVQRIGGFLRERRPMAAAARMAIGGRVQPVSARRGLGEIAGQTSEELRKLRGRFNAARERGDDEEARRLAVEILRTMAKRQRFGLQVPRRTEQTLQRIGA